jgi:glycosyltransferase involved in cell wall biosynthesis
MPARPRKKLLIFVIAYYAEATLKRVLERIPAEIFQQFDCEVLVVDDASEDRTFAIGREYKEAHPEIRMTVLRNEYNQGYGGNQKVGYSYAVAEQFDYVAMVHGDGQYAPEELPNLMQPLVDGEADAVFGSRMMTLFGSLKGGMPLYKWLGNRVLTTAQNALLRTKLSEFHSGYRIYSTAALKRVPFQLNANDFHFDTEIIIQLLNARQRIVERAIPTFYGDEISRVNGFKYARDVMLATVKNVFHRSGLLWQRRFEPLPDPERDVDARDDLKLGYSSSHQWALDAVHEGASVIDIGGGDALAGELKKKGCDVKKVAAQDPPDFDVSRHQYLLLLDVIEHLPNPEAFIEQLRKQFDYEPKRLVLTTPNVGFAVPRLMLLLGQFNYGKVGILSRSHTRLFTFRSIQRLLRDAGFRIKEVRGVPAPFPKVFGQGAVGMGLLKANELAIKLSRTLFAYQVFIVAESTPSVDFVLSSSKEQSRRRASRLHSA